MAEPEPPGSPEPSSQPEPPFPPEPAVRPEPLGEEEFLEALADWAAGERVTGAARSRSRLRSLNEAAAGSATLAGILVDLAERATEATLWIGATGAVSAQTLNGLAPPAHPTYSGRSAGSRLTGRLVGVGQDFCVLQQDNAGHALVRTAAVTAIWPLPDRTGTIGPGRTPRDRRPVPTAPAGERHSPLSLSLLAALAELATQRTPVSLHTATGRIDAELWAVGQDVVTLRAPGADPRPRQVLVPAAAILFCELR